MTRWRRTASGIEVESERETYLVDRLILCAGAWTGQLLGGLLPLTCERQVPFWFSSQGKACFLPDKMPIFILEEASGFFYGIPDVGRGVKVALTHQGRTVEPDQVDRRVTEEDSAPVKAFVEKRLPGLVRNPIASTTCLYTNTPDLNFVVGAHPDDGRVLIVSACSGHGFKFASVLGEVVADMASDRRTAFDLSFIGVDRFVT